MTHSSGRVSPSVKGREGDILSLALFPHTELMRHKLQHQDKPRDLYPLITLTHRQMSLHKCSSLCYTDTKLSPSGVKSWNVCSEMPSVVSPLELWGLLSQVPAQWSHPQRGELGVSVGVRQQPPWVSCSYSEEEDGCPSSFQDSTLKPFQKTLLQSPLHTYSFQTRCWLHFLGWVGTM